MKTQLNKKPPSGDTLRRGDLYTTGTTGTTNNTSGSSYESDRLTKKPPTGESTRDKDINNSSSNRLSASLSSSSLARYVATSALDIYEKYSPAHYKPNTDLTRSSSRSSLVDANETSNNNNSSSSNYDNNNDITTHVTLERPRSRYSRLYSNDSTPTTTTSTNDTTDTTDGSATLTSRRRGTDKLYNSSSANSLNLSQTNSSNDVPTATFTLRNRTLSTGRCSVSKSSLDGGTNGVDSKMKNGIANGLDKELKELKLKHDTTTTHNNYNNNNGTTNNNDVEVSVTLKLDENKQNDKVNTKCNYKQPINNNNNNYYLLLLQQQTNKQTIIIIKKSVFTTTFLLLLVERVQITYLHTISVLHTNKMHR